MPLDKVRAPQNEVKSIAKSKYPESLISESHVLLKKLHMPHLQVSLCARHYRKPSTHYGNLKTFRLGGEDVDFRATASISQPTGFLADDRRCKTGMPDLYVIGYHC